MAGATRPQPRLILELAGGSEFAGMPVGLGYEVLDVDSLNAPPAPASDLTLCSCATSALKLNKYLGEVPHPATRLGTHTLPVASEVRSHP